MEIQREDICDISELKKRGWGSRSTILRRVKRGELPEPFQYGKSHNSKWFWNKADINALEVELGISPFFFVTEENKNSLRDYSSVEEAVETITNKLLDRNPEDELERLKQENSDLKAQLEAIKVLLK